MSELLFEIIKLVVIIAITFVVKYGVPLLKQWVENSKFNQIVEWAKIAVEAAEQKITDSGAGAEKKAIVTEFLRSLLTAKNISISDEQLDSLIESAVFAMNKAQTKLE